ncbi:PAS factor family protein [Photobacterium toruni]|uniref:PAS factor family protein n=1 Tax=Photobacterium toruni TaxID=1935446 RepID=A0A1T4R5Q7_9GAMM|nr:PAS factor family protein [Photobacterium toruni]MEC6813621.1 PAS factor family protein [Photobacterium toruni]MEC6830571.1 PAS factor family protein [Photobacterium toruni]SKA11372.1 Pas factor saposin fold protein [Photobacterium toruni]
MNNVANLIYDTLIDLSNNAPERHSEICQNLYNQLDLPLDKQLSLYSNALGPASSGMLENHADFNNTLNIAVRALELSEK